MKREKDLHPKVKTWLEQSFPNCWIYKTHDTATRGIPDIHAVCGGYPIWIELKLKHSLNELQHYTLKRIQNAGGLAFVMKEYMICLVDNYDMQKQEPSSGWDIRSTTAQEVMRIAKEKVYEQYNRK